MLGSDLDGGASEGILPTQPFVGHDPQSILIARKMDLAFQHLRGHIEDCTNRGGDSLRVYSLSHQNEGKIAEARLILGSAEEILPFYIPVNQTRLMGVMRCRSHLLHQRDKFFARHTH